jgi:hypothetical protein
MTLPPSVTDYFTHLAAGRFVDAAACFSEDVFYSHEAYDPASDGPTGSRLEAEGREALAAMFGLRAVRDWRHEITPTVVGARFFIDGRVFDAQGAPVLSFLSVGELDESGLISSYLEYDTRPAVGHASRVQPDGSVRPR